MLRIIFCGDRNWKDISAIRMVASAIQANVGVFTIVEGEAEGADKLSRKAGEELDLPVVPKHAHWDHHFRHDRRCEQSSWDTCDRPLCPPDCKEVVGRAAGPIRNTKMLIDEKADAVVAFHLDLTQSKGTANMVKQARVAARPTWVYTDGPDALGQFILKLKLLHNQKYS